MLEVGFNGTSSLSYSFIEPLEKTNEDEDESNVVIEKQFTLSMSFLALSPNGILMGTTGLSPSQTVSSDCFRILFAVMYRYVKYAELEF